MSKLYYSPGACSLAVHILLEWIGEPYEAIKVDYHDPGFKTINPAGAVPALDYGGRRPLTQCAAILEYLAQTHPAADLMVDEAPESRAEQQRWLSFLTGDLHPSFFPVFMPARYTVATEALELDRVREAGRLLIQSKLKLLEDHMSDRTWMLGGKKTILDAYATPMLNWADGTLTSGLNAYPALKGHHSMMLADPAVRRVMMAEGIAKD